MSFDRLWHTIIVKDVLKIQRYCAMAEIQIICGDFPQGKASLSFWQLTMPAKGRLLGENIVLVELEDLQIASAEQIGVFGERSQWPETHEVVKRQFEAHVAAAKKNEVIFVGAFADGRKFLASTKGKTYKKILNDWDDAKKKGFKREVDKTVTDKSRESNRIVIFLALAAVGLLAVSILVLQKESEIPSRSKSEPTKAIQSAYERDITKATTSHGLSKADIAWHAINTYGWDCAEVVGRGKMTGDYYLVTCSSGLRLRVYPRQGRHPKITNSKGGYD